MKFHEIANDPRPRLLPVAHPHLAVLLIECVRMPALLRQIRHANTSSIAGFTRPDLGYSTVCVACATAAERGHLENQWN